KLWPVFDLGWHLIVKTTILKLTHCITQSSSFLTAHLAINNGLNLLMDTNDVLLIIPCYWNGCLDNECVCVAFKMVLGSGCVCVCVCVCFCVCVCGCGAFNMVWGRWGGATW